MTRVAPRHEERIARLLIVSCLLLLVASCAHQPEPSGDDLPGFFSGIFHGFFMIFSLIASIFSDVRVYAFPNAGGWYDFGFFLGASTTIGGIGATIRLRA